MISENDVEVLQDDQGATGENDPVLHEDGLRLALRDLQIHVGAEFDDGTPELR
jgi:hypothetical protein